jgi:hypothetical protein
MERTLDCAEKERRDKTNISFPRPNRPGPAPAHRDIFAILFFPLSLAMDKGPLAP